MYSQKDGRWVNDKISLQSDTLGLASKRMGGSLENDEEVRKDRELLNEITSCDLEELCRRQRGVVRNFL